LDIQREAGDYDYSSRDHLSAHVKYLVSLVSQDRVLGGSHFWVLSLNRKASKVVLNETLIRKTEMYFKTVALLAIVALKHVDGHGYAYSPRTRNWFAVEEGTEGQSVTGLPPKEYCPDVSTNQINN